MPIFWVTFKDFSLIQFMIACYEFIFLTHLNPISCILCIYVFLYRDLFLEKLPSHLFNNKSLKTLMNQIQPNKIVVHIETKNS